MAGTIVASVIFVQSGGTQGYCPKDTATETWDASRKSTVLSQVSQGLNFWTTRSQRPKELTFAVEDLGAVLGKSPRTL